MICAFVGCVWCWPGRVLGDTARAKDLNQHINDLICIGCLGILIILFQPSIAANHPDCDLRIDRALWVELLTAGSEFSVYYNVATKSSVAGIRKRRKQLVGFNSSVEVLSDEILTLMCRLCTSSQPFLVQIPTI